MLKKNKNTMLLVALVTIVAVVMGGLAIAGGETVKADNTPCARICTEDCHPLLSNPLLGTEEMAVDDCITMCLQARCNENVRNGDCSATLADGCCNIFALAGQDPDCCSDSDGDGTFGTPYGCGSPNDCNDNDASTYPGATEICGDGIDNNCDGRIDEPLSPMLLYRDVDLDGYGGPTLYAACVSCMCNPPPGTVLNNNQDCNDASATVYPGAAEVSCDGIDQDCDGVDLCAEEFPTI